MKAFLTPTLACLFVCPAILIAGEPSNGPLIMLSSISGWLLLAGGWVTLRQFRRKRLEQRLLDQ